MLGDYDSLLIVDQEGICVYRFGRADIESNTDEIITIVDYLLSE